MSSGESERWTMGQDDGNCPLARGGCGRENISLKTGECSARMPLNTQKSTSPAARITVPSSYQNSSSVLLIAHPSDASSDCVLDRLLARTFAIFHKSRDREAAR